ncbi:Transcription factor gsfR2 [Talaromyces pinophilus]|nr:Transcription factor gsfR2 [Talaromyces pinophilus]
MENACKPCARTKRKCERQAPQCARCRRRGIECIYPPAKQASFVLRKDGYSSAQDYGSTPYNWHTLNTPGSELSPYSYGKSLEATELNVFYDCITGLETPPLPNWADTFLPTSGLDFLSISAGRPVASEQLVSYVAMLHIWLTQWVDQGSNPFIHAFLYKARMPLCVQDAYTTLSSYLHKKTTNEQMIFSILEERVRQLVATQGLKDWPEKDQNVLHSMDHLARVQSLLIYLIMGLFDGDIRLRHFTESQMPVLDRWVGAMIDHSNQMLSTSAGSVREGQLYSRLNIPNVTDRENLNWHCWIVAESTQRTWMVAAAIQAVYSMMQLGKMPQCPGSMVVTTGRGIWEAPSAVAWSRLCLETKLGIIRMSEAERLFVEALPEEVDDFMKVFLEATFGKDRMERWLQTGTMIGA